MACGLAGNGMQFQKFYKPLLQLFLKELFLREINLTITFHFSKKKKRSGVKALTCRLNAVKATEPKCKSISIGQQNASFFDKRTTRLALSGYISSFPSLHGNRA